MEVYFDTQAVYQWLIKDVVGGQELRGIDIQNTDLDAVVKASLKEERSSNNDALVARVSLSEPIPLVLPFASVDSQVARFGPNFVAIVDLNFPKLKGDNRNWLLKKVRSRPNIRNVAAYCMRTGAFNRLKSQYGDRYHMTGPGITGYVADREESSILIGDGLFNSKFLRFRIGGAGLKRKEFDGEDGLEIDLGVLSKVANYALNGGIDEAVKIGLTESNPDIKLRLGPMA